MAGLGFTLGAAQFGTTVVLDSIQSQSVNPAIELMIGQGSSRIDPSHAAKVGESPQIQLATISLADALTFCGFNGKAIDVGGSPNTAANLYFQRYKQGSDYDAADAMRATVNLALMYLMSIEAGVGPEPAVATYGIVPVFDGTNDPIVYTKGITYAVPFEAEENWTVGPFYLNGTKVPTVQRIRVLVTPEIRRERDGGKVFPIGASIRRRAPVIEIDVLDLDEIDTSSGLGSKGVPITGVTRAYFAKTIKGATLEIDAATKHLECEIADGIATWGTLSAQSTADAGYTIRVTATRDAHEATPPDAIKITINKAISGI
jgi:hypothetical protein